ncbi:hypothetical protein GIB67_000212 [Kingdonia uniflora]|uniref:Glycosyltransferase subfamily 4-like N-terminal domain-containing protein n=1 Tax=Kingdonia uniflora TaxID=39325 RepID=A0A7J7PAA6_9MAGN|nr:hypothetical protein GIB67_000212 [Kingdonia uniflora]
MERHASTLYTALTARGHEIHVFTVASDRLEYPDIHNGGLHVHFAANDRGLLYCSLAFEIFNRDNLERSFDYVHTESVALPHWHAKMMPKVAITWHGIWKQHSVPDNARIMMGVAGRMAMTSPGSATEALVAIKGAKAGKDARVERVSIVTDCKRVIKMGRFDMCLIITIVKKWWPTTYTFYFLEGDVEFTPIDLYMMSGFLTVIPDTVPLAYDVTCEEVNIYEDFLLGLPSHKFKSMAIRNGLLIEYAKVLNKEPDTVIYSTCMILISPTKTARLDWGT